jgi:hypothetical protein
MKRAHLFGWASALFLIPYNVFIFFMFVIRLSWVELSRKSSFLIRHLRVSLHSSKPRRILRREF